MNDDFQFDVDGVGLGIWRSDSGSGPNVVLAMGNELDARSVRMDPDVARAVADALLDAAHVPPKHPAEYRCGHHGVVGSDDSWAIPITRDDEPAFLYHCKMPPSDPLMHAEGARCNRPLIPLPLPARARCKRCEAPLNPPSGEVFYESGEWYCFPACESDEETAVSEAPELVLLPPLPRGG